MTAENTSKCMSCGRTGQKVRMVRVVSDGYVVGYRHRSCEDFENFPKSIDTGSIYEDYMRHFTRVH